MSNNEVRFLVSLGIDPKDLKVQADKALKEYKNHTINFNVDTKLLESSMSNIIKQYTGKPLNLVFDVDIKKSQANIQQAIKKLKIPTVTVDVNARGSSGSVRTADVQPNPTSKSYTGNEAQVIQQVTKEYQALGQQVTLFGANSAQSHGQFIQSLKEAGNQVEITRKGQNGAITSITATYRNSANEIQRTYFKPLEVNYSELSGSIGGATQKLQGFLATTRTLKNTETFDLSQGINKFSMALDKARHNIHITEAEYTRLQAKLGEVVSKNQLDAMNQSLKQTVATESRRIELLEKQNRLKVQQAKLEADLVRLQNMHPRYAIQNEQTLLNLRQKINDLKMADAYQANSSNILGLNRADFTQAQRNLESLRASVNKTGADAADAMRNSMGLVESLRIAVQRFPVWMISSTLFYQTAAGIKDLTDKTIELDTAMTNMKRVMQLPEHAFNDMLESAITNTTTLSGKLDEMLTLVSEFGRMGFNDIESLDLSNTAQMLSNISELKPNESVSSLVAGMISFNIEASKSINIADKLNEIDNNFAVTTRDLSTAMNKSASTAAVYNVSLEEMLGNVAAISSATRESG